MCTCVCVCACVREIERECLCVCVCPCSADYQNYLPESDWSPYLSFSLPHYTAAVLAITIVQFRF